MVHGVSSVLSFSTCMSNRISSLEVQKLNFRFSTSNQFLLVSPHLSINSIFPLAHARNLRIDFHTPSPNPTGVPSEYPGNLSSPHPNLHHLAPSHCHLSCISALLVPKLPKILLPESRGVSLSKCKFMSLRSCKESASH